MAVLCSVSLSHSAMCWSTVCNCGNIWLYSLFGDLERGGGGGGGEEGFGGGGERERDKEREMRGLNFLWVIVCISSTHLGVYKRVKRITNAFSKNS